MTKSEVPFMSLLFLIQHHRLVGNSLTLLFCIFSLALVVRVRSFHTLRFFLSLM